MTSPNRSVVCILLVAFTAGMMIALGGCSKTGKLATSAERSGGLWSIKVSSTAFEDGGMIPA
jgi:hypothetical protein